MNTLIALIITLLIQVQAPSVPLETKVQALQLAQQVLAAAQIENAGSAEVSLPAGNTPGEIGSALESPTCTLGVEVAPWRTTWHAIFSWTYTSGSTVVIKNSDGGKVPLVYYNGNAGAIVSNDSSHQQKLYGPSLFQDADYEMDVTLNGQTGSCTAHAVVPTTPAN